MLQKYKNPSIKALTIVRLLIGLLFIVSGAEKLISPYQNFLYVIQSYEVLPAALEVPTAKFFPWAEFFLGLFLLLGLWIPHTLVGTMLMVGIFIAIVSQAIIRGLPITECGCFGELASFPLQTVLFIDCTVMGLLVILKSKQAAISAWSLDQYFRDSK